MRLQVVVIVLVTQGLFTAGDVLARLKLRTAPDFTLSALIAPWFVAYLTLRQIATFGQLYILAKIELGRTAGFYAVAGLLTANVIALLFLGEKLTTQTYIGLLLAVAAIVVLALDVRT